MPRFHCRCRLLHKCLQICIYFSRVGMEATLRFFDIETVRSCRADGGAGAAAGAAFPDHIGASMSPSIFLRRRPDLTGTQPHPGRRADRPGAVTPPPDRPHVPSPPAAAIAGSSARETVSPPGAVSQPPSRGVRQLVAEGLAL